MQEADLDLRRQELVKVEEQTLVVEEMEMRGEAEKVVVETEEENSRKKPNNVDLYGRNGSGRKMKRMKQKRRWRREKGKKEVVIVV